MKRIILGLLNPYLIFMTLLYAAAYSRVFSFNINKLVRYFLSIYLVGFMVSFIGVFLNVSLYINSSIVIIILISFMLKFINRRFMCLAYLYPLYVLIIYILNLNVNLDIRGMIGFIGLMHFGEGLLIYCSSKFRDEREIEYLNEKTYIKEDFILPLSISVITNFDMKVLLDKNLITVFDVLSSDTLGKYLVYSMFFFIGYGRHKIKGDNARHIMKNDAIKLIIYSFILILIYLYLKDNEEYIVLALIGMFLFHEYIIDDKNFN